MISEGKGIVSPARIKVSLLKSDVSMLVEEARRRGAIRYGNRNDTYGRGMITGSLIELAGVALPMAAKPILIGLAGEWAVLEALRKRCEVARGLDLAIHELGDGGKDLEVRGVRIDVKCRSQPINNNRVRTHSASGWAIRAASNAYVFCEWCSKDFIDVLGWVTKEELLDWQTEKRQAGHTNAIGTDEDLKPFCGLVSLINAQL